MSAVVNGLTMINLTGFKPGVQQDETGINIKTFKSDVEPEFRNLVPKKNGTARGIVVAPMKLGVTLDGEVTGSTGVMAAVIGTAFDPANSTAYFGAPTTELWLVKGGVEESREQGALVSMNAEFDAYAGVTEVGG